MARTTKVQRELARAAELRLMAVQLRHLPHHDWRDWELDWLDSEIGRRADYIYSEREWVILNQLLHDAKSFSSYADYTVPELILIAYAGRCDLGEGAQEFVERIYRWSATALKRRQIQRLAGICRIFETIGYDELVDYDPREQLESLSSAA